ncbi:MAG: nicotinate phosphoribosyltransferase [Acidobacteria bacterium]|nr:nicotinate phosphoribosyltransferase [Acidobacteriota bacterium]
MNQPSDGLHTDLYQLTMAAAYFDNHLQHQVGSFELFVRALPTERSYLLAAGLETALDYLHTLRFTAAQLDYLRAHPSFQNVSREFFAYLAAWQFTGDVWAMAEGTVVFANEPLLRISAPIIEAQIVETFLLATLNFQTLIASKAARLVSAAQGRPVIEFGTRRAHGAEAGLYAARAAFLGGCRATSNVEAGFRWGLPTLGTLAHSFIQSFDNEDAAFRAFLKVFPDSATLLVDTYDTLAAVKRLAASAENFSAIRLDSGDLLHLSSAAREILDRAGKREVKIFASGDLNEYLIADLLQRGAPIDAFGVGTQLSTSFDHPALGGIYKLVGVAINGQVKLKMKLSADKATYPGTKQVWRQVDANGLYGADVIALEDEKKPEKSGDWRPLLQPVMIQGVALEERLIEEEWMQADELVALRNLRWQRLQRARRRAAQELQRLPQECLQMRGAASYPVRFSQRLTAEKARLQQAFESPS